MIFTGLIVAFISCYIQAGQLEKSRSTFVKGVETDSGCINYESYSSVWKINDEQEEFHFFRGHDCKESQRVLRKRTEAREEIIGEWQGYMVFKSLNEYAFKELVVFSLSENRTIFSSLLAVPHLMKKSIVKNSDMEEETIYREPVFSSNTITFFTPIGRNATPSECENVVSYKEDYDYHIENGGPEPGQLAQLKRYSLDSKKLITLDEIQCYTNDSLAG